MNKKNVWMNFKCTKKPDLIDGCFPTQLIFCNNLN